MKLFEFNGNWTVDYTLEAFNGLQGRRGAYASASNQISDGKVSLTIIDDTSESPDPYPQQISAINFIIQNPDTIRDILRNGISSIYEDLKTQYGYNQNDKETTSWFPKINEVQDFDNVFGVANVFVQISEKDGISYVGIECGCTWDDEHGLGFLIHKDKLIAIGGADKAFSWDDVKDNGTYDIVQDNLRENNLKVPVKYRAHSKYGKLKPSQEESNRLYESILIRRGFNDKFKTEVENGLIDLDINQSYLELAVSSNNTELIEFLLLKKAKIRYALHKTRRDLNLIDLLINNGADINSKDLGGNTLLFQMISELVKLYDHRSQSELYKWNKEEELNGKINDQISFIKELLHRGANPKIENLYKFDCYSSARNLPENLQKEIEGILTSN